MNSSKKLERYYPTIVTAVVFVIIGAVASQVLLPREAPLQEGDLISGVLERLDELEAGHDVQKSYI